MPIKNLTESTRMPRLGKFHLGIKHPEKGYPMKTDYFVIPKDHSDYGTIVELYGEQPKELRILIPVEDEEEWATQYYKSYNQTYGLVCKGDGETALRMIDIETKELPVKDKAGTVRMMEIPCPGKDCPIYQNKEKGKPQCHERMELRFILPEVPGLGVWQIDTGSINSILNINSCARIIKKAFGRISLIPLKLTLEPIPVNNPETGKKQTVYVLNLRTDITLAQLADAAREQAKTLLLEAPSLEDAFDAELEEQIAELWGPAEMKPELEKPDSAQILAHMAPKPEPKPAKVKATKPPSEPPAESELKETIAEIPEEDPLFATEPPAPVLGPIINMTWLQNILTQRKWKDVTMKSYLKNTYKVSDEGTVEDVIARLNEEQQKALLQEATEWEKML